MQLFAPTVLTREELAQPVAEPGTLLEADPKQGLIVAAGEGAVRIGEVKPAGRARMEAAAWIRGRGAERGDRFH